MSFSTLLISFLISWAVSAIIILISIKIMGEKEGIGIAFLVALFGSLAYTVAHYFLGFGFLSALIGGIVWLIVLRIFYKIGWIRSILISVVIWVIAFLVGILFPAINKLI